MKENKVVIVKTRGGKILRLMKEHYLRDDIEHGIGAALDSSPENRPNSFCSRVRERYLPRIGVSVLKLESGSWNSIENSVRLDSGFRAQIWALWSFLAPLDSARYKRLSPQSRCARKRAIPEHHHFANRPQRSQTTIWPELQETPKFDRLRKKSLRLRERILRRDVFEAGQRRKQQWLQRSTDKKSSCVL